jgi:thiol-disulfide isomerase/thioredoxin
MRPALIAFAIFSTFSPAFAQDKPTGPTSEKAQKSYKEALSFLHERKEEFALDSFKKADKQDDGHCPACQKQIIKYAIKYEDWKSAERAAEEMLADAQGNRDTALAHYQMAVVLLNEGQLRHKDEFFSRAHDEISKALAAVANFPDAVFDDGIALAYLHQDDAAKSKFEQYIKMNSTESPDRQRAARYIARPELARSRMAPPFAVTTLDGHRVSMDDLAGKVVLLDFWATWCQPCREALPHIRNVAKKFQGQPLVILSVSLDTDEQKWKDFVAKNEMTWPQYRDAGFTGQIAKMFGVNAIPHTFTIDSTASSRKSTSATPPSKAN